MTEQELAELASLAKADPLFVPVAPEKILALISLLQAQQEEIGRLREAARKAVQLAEIASDWNLYEVEIDGQMVSIYDLKREFAASTQEGRKALEARNS